MQHNHSSLLAQGRFRRTQCINFFITVIAPPVLAIGTLIATGLERWLTWQGFFTFLVTWYLTGCIGVSVGLHRYFSHRSFSATPLLKRLLAILAIAAGQGPIVYWVSVHRHHHAVSDQPADIHSPHRHPNAERSRIRRWIESHVLWILSHDVPSPRRYARDVLSDSSIANLDRWYWHVFAAGLLAPGLCLLAVDLSLDAFLTGVFWGGIVRVAIGHHIIWSINSFCHLVGRRVFETKDHSRNVWLLALPSWGESWHNNHHHMPYSPRIGAEWWQLDLGYVTIRCLAAIGLATLKSSSGTRAPLVP